MTTAPRLRGMLGRSVVDLTRPGFRWEPGVLPIDPTNTVFSSQHTHPVIRTAFDIGFAANSFKSVLGICFRFLLVAVRHQSIPRLRGKWLVGRKRCHVYLVVPTCFIEANAQRKNYASRATSEKTGNSYKYGLRASRTESIWKVKKGPTFRSAPLLLHLLKTAKHSSSHPPDTALRCGRSPTVRDSVPPASVPRNSGGAFAARCPGKGRFPTFR